LGEKNSGNQPSPISAASATFFGPSAPSQTAEARAAVVGHVEELAVVLDGSVAANDGAHDLDVLTRACQRLRVRLAVPPLDDLRTRCPEAEDEAASREVIERDRRHGRGGRCAGAHLHDRRAEPHR
jgi:hypothetical protein